MSTHECSRNAEIRRRVAAGEPQAKIGAEYGLTRQRISQLTRAAMPGRAATVRSLLAAVDPTAIAETSVTELARRLNLSRDAVSHALRTTPDLAPLRAQFAANRRHQQRLSTAYRRRLARDVQRAVREQTIQQTRQLSRLLGRAPRLAELAQYVGTSVSSLCLRFRGRPGGYAIGSARLYRLAGVARPREMGRPRRDGATQVAA